MDWKGTPEEEVREALDPHCITVLLVPRVLITCHRVSYNAPRRAGRATHNPAGGRRPLGPDIDSFSCLTTLGTRI